MECNECNGIGWVNVWNPSHDVMMKEKCIPCMAHERDLKDLTLAVSKIIVNASKQRLAMALANALIKHTDDVCMSDLSNIEALIKTKDIEGIFMSINMM